MNDLSPADYRLVTLLIWLNVLLLSVIIIYFTVKVIRPSILRRLAGMRNDSVIQSGPPECENAAADEADKAAIAAALYLYFNEMHDEESDIITVKRVSKTYSPWSSKLYSMRNLR
ncbi:MAG: hypothetical protein GYA41_09045 [Bacteroidales bacterium]|jgi:hypothetical protein|nr:hypothetical protein [Bacteroidales bacterium]